MLQKGLTAAYEWKHLQYKIKLNKKWGNEEIELEGKWAKKSKRPPKNAVSSQNKQGAQLSSLYLLQVDRKFGSQQEEKEGDMIHSI